MLCRLLRDPPRRRLVEVPVIGVGPQQVHVLFGTDQHSVAVPPGFAEQVGTHTAPLPGYTGTHLGVFHQQVEVVDGLGGLPRHRRAAHMLDTDDRAAQSELRVGRRGPDPQPRTIGLGDLHDVQEVTQDVLWHFVADEELRWIS